MNNCVFVGRMVDEPELKMTQTGICVCRFSIAVKRITTKEEESADFFEIETWRGTAEFAARHLHKGMRIAVVGSMHQRSYTDKQGNQRKVYYMTADNVEFADGKWENRFKTPTTDQDNGLPIPNIPQDNSQGYGYPYPETDDLPF